MAGSELCPDAWQLTAWTHDQASQLQLVTGLCQGFALISRQAPGWLFKPLTLPAGEGAYRSCRPLVHGR